jgi:spore germination protein
MYKVNRREILSSLLFFLCLMLSIVSLKAQHELKVLLDKTVEAKIRKANSRKNEQLFQVFNNLKSDTIAVVKNDTAIRFEDKKIIEPFAIFDTIEFQRRNQTVKNRRPSNMLNNEEGWQRSLLLTHSNAYKKEHKLDSTKNIFGWHPYWMGTAYYSYNFSLLSAVAYTSYEVNPATGYYNSIHDWRTTKLIDSAHAHKCKVLLSVTNFGSENNAQFLSNLNAQHIFINTLITLLRERNADGVNIDFENIPRSAKHNLTNFIIDLSSSMHNAKKDYLITIALPAIDFDYVYDIKQLNKYVDLFIIMGYEFYGQNSSVAGPVAPLGSGTTWWPYNLEKAVMNILFQASYRLSFYLVCLIMVQNGRLKI